MVSIIFACSVSEECAKLVLPCCFCVKRSHRRRASRYLSTINGGQVGASLAKEVGAHHARSGYSRGIDVERMIGVYTGERQYHFDGLDVMPVQMFLRQLHAGEVF